MPTVRLSFTPAAAHVRTARLVSVAVARRAGVADDLIDEVRQAIGEACSRAVALHRRHGLADLIDVTLSEGDRFVVRVCDRAPIDSALGGGLPDPSELPDPTSLLDEAGAQSTAAETAQAAEEQVAVGMGIALLAGLVDDLRVVPGADGIGTEVRMTWPAAPRGLTGHTGRGQPTPPRG